MPGCLLRFAPLVMILHRVDFLFNNRAMKKVKMSNLQVAGYVGLMLSFNVVILVVWSAVDPPAAVDVQQSYPSVYAKVSNKECSTGLSSPFEVAMLLEQCLLILFGIFKVSGWDCGWVARGSHNFIFQKLSQVKNYSKQIHTGCTKRKQSSHGQPRRVGTYKSNNNGDRVAIMLIPYISESTVCAMGCVTGCAMAGLDQVAVVVFVSNAG